MVEVADTPTYSRVEIYAGEPQLEELQSLLAKAKRPLAIVGGGGWTQRAVDDLKIFAEAFDLPVAASFRCQDMFDNTHRNYAGDLGLAAGPKLIRHVKDCDLLISIGARLGEMTTGAYTLIDIPVPKQTLVHIHSGAEELGRVYHAALAINASPAGFLSQAAKLKPASAPAWTEWTRSAHADYLENLKHPQTPGDVQMGDVMEWLRKHLKSDAILTMGAGNYTAWAHRFYQYRTFRSQLGPTNGSMGYGVPAAVAAKITAPERTVVAFAGDGCFLMNGQELATAMQYDARVIFLVINNGMYGTIRMHQERNYPGRVSGTRLTNPDFASLARSYGLHGETVEKTEDFMGAFERCEASGKPGLIEVRIDPEALTVKQTLSQIRDQAIAQGK